MTSKKRNTQGAFANASWGGALPAQSANGINPTDFIMDFSNGKDASLSPSDSEIRLTSQKIKHREILFKTCMGVCGALYLMFIILVICAWRSDAFFQTLLNYKHIGAFILALLIVPSALLWGLLRAAYMPEYSPKETDSMAKIAASLHPAGDA